MDFRSGARIHVLGAESADNLRGIGLAGCVLDEMATFPPNVWQEIVRPMLSNRQGWATFIGTPKGRNEFYRLHQTAVADPANWFSLLLTADQSGVLPQHELDDLQRTMSAEQYRQEYLCDFTAALVGSYYGQLLASAEQEGRITRVAPVPGIAIDTAWGLGIGDSTAIWAHQVLPDGEGLLILGSYENHGQPLQHYVAELNSRGWTGGTDWLPHDARVRSLDTGRTRVETLAQLGRNPCLVPMQTVADGINAVRLTLPKCWFDTENCREGLECLRQYSQAWDGRNNCFIDHPKHDEHSHQADAFRYLSVAWRTTHPDPIEYPQKPKLSLSGLTFDEYDDLFTSYTSDSGVQWAKTAKRPRPEPRI